MEGFHTFDLQTLGEMKGLFEHVLKTGNIPMEQRNKMEFYVRYCHQLQVRIQDQMKKERMEAGVIHESTSHL